MRILTALFAGIMFYVFQMLGWVMIDGTHNAVEMSVVFCIVFFFSVIVLVIAYALISLMTCGIGLFVFFPLLFLDGLFALWAMTQLFSGEVMVTPTFLPVAVMTVTLGFVGLFSGASASSTATS